MVCAHVNNSSRDAPLLMVYAHVNSGSFMAKYHMGNTGTSAFATKRHHDFNLRESGWREITVPTPKSSFGHDGAS
jgi:hypothetical protein